MPKGQILFKGYANLGVIKEQILEEYWRTELQKDTLNPEGIEVHLRK